MLERRWPIIEAAFWILVFGIAYVAMMKAMHPGFQVFGI